MAFPTQTLDAIKTRARAFFRSAFQGKPMGIKQFLGQLARAVAATVWALHKAVEDLWLDIVPQPTSSRDALASWAFVAGLTDGNGGYGPLVSVPATGGIANPTGEIGTVFSDGQQAVAEDGATVVEVSGGPYTIPGSGAGSGSVQVTLVAVTPGEVGNLVAGTKFTWIGAPPGADATFSLAAALEGGADVEASSGIYARLLQRGQNPPRGGNSTDIDTWVRAAVKGVAATYVYPKRSGTGTVDVLFTVSGTGQARLPTSTQVAAAQAAIDKARAPGAEKITASAPYAPGGRGHLVKVRANPSGTANVFDWGSDAPGTAYAVDAGGYVGGASPTLRLTGLAPQSLKTAVDSIAVTGLKPRLQVLSTGGDPVNAPVAVVAYADAGGKTTLTLDTLPSTGFTAPSDGDMVYPYGPIVEAVADVVVALCDALGPSRASGYGDAYDTWSDELFIGQITRAVEDVTDSGGNLLIAEVIDGGVTVDGAATSVRGIDDSTNAPELLYLSHVAVTE